MTMASSRDTLAHSTVRTLFIQQSPWAELDPAKHLLEFIDELSQKRLHDDHHDGAGDACDSCTPTTHYQLSLLCVHLTPRIIKLLIELLNANLPGGAQQGKSPREGTINVNVNNNQHKWHSVVLNQCRVVQHSAYFPMDREDLTMDTISCFGSTLANRVNSITIQDSPGLLDCLLNAEPNSWNMTSLFLHERKGINAMECSQLGHFIQSNTSVKELNLHSTFLEAPEELGRGLASARHLEVLCLGRNFGLCRTMKELRNGLSTLVVGTTAAKVEGSSGSGSDSSSSTITRITGAVAQLLQDPQSRLKRLDLSNMELYDDHLIAISQLLCTRSRHGPRNDMEDISSSSDASGSRLEELNVSFNRLHSRSIMEFARLLPRMQFLRKATLGPNPWDESYKAAQCKTALLQGLIQSSSVEFLDIFMTKIPLMHDDDNDGLFSSVVHYHVLLNRAGRRILTSIDPVPLALWSQILERAGTTISYPPPPSLKPSTISTTSTTTENIASAESSMLRMVSEHECRASAVFYLLSNAPILISS